ncbi:MAG TPA: FecR domain-containing protein, partial [Longimicrobium sp.]|nr:FecR domain-containing protein [Longimicrobium sp.]
MSDERASGREPDWDAIARSLAGEDTPEEADAFRRELADHPQRAAMVGALDGAARRLPGADVDVEAALASVMARRDAPAAVIPLRPARRWTPVVLRAAAVILVLIGASFFWRSRGGSPETAARSYATTVGARTQIVFPDGSRATLGPASTLTMAAGYGAPERRVELRGEAYFEVEHDAARPFVIHTPDAVVRDLGTTFTVRADSVSGTRVAVTSGIVGLAPVGGAETTLRPGDRGFVAGGRVTAERGAAGADDVAWTRGRLVFRDA